MKQTSIIILLTLFMSMAGANSLAQHNQVKATPVAKNKQSSLSEVKKDIIGDANDDGKVDQKDIEIVEEFIMTGEKPEGFNWNNANVNIDDKVDVADIVLIINLIKESIEIELSDIIILTEDIDDWSELRVCKDGSLYLSKNSDDGNPTDFVFVTGAESENLLFGYVISDADGNPRTIGINDYQILIKDLRDDMVSMTIVYKNSIASYFENVPLSYSSSNPVSKTRAWNEMTWRGKTSAVLECAAGLLGAFSGAATMVIYAGALPVTYGVSALGIAGGAIAFQQGLEAIEEGIRRIGEPGYKGNSDVVKDAALFYASYNLDQAIEQYGGIPHPNAGQLSLASKIADLLKIISKVTDDGVMITWEDMVQSYQGKVVTGLNKDITTNSVIVRGYVDPAITVSPIDGKPISNEYGIVLSSTVDSKDRMTQNVTDGSGGLIEFSFGNLKPSTKYEYRAYYLDKTNNISLLGDLESFRTSTDAVSITDFEVNNAEYDSDGFSYGSQKYKYKFECTTTVQLNKDDGSIEDWGYVYEDSDGNKSHISIKGLNTNPYADTRYVYYRNEPVSSVRFYGYVKYANDEDCYYGTTKDYKLEYKGLCPDDNHPHMIDLGLPSGIKWACCNVDAISPKEDGGKYAWGEIETKEEYTMENYKHLDYIYRYEGTDFDQPKCIDIGTIISGTPYDVAHVKWGDGWIMPTEDMIAELDYYCIKTPYSFGYHSGKLLTGPNGNKIFLPIGSYWSGNLPDPDRRGGSFGFASAMEVFNDRPSLVTTGWPGRWYGFYIRPVAK